MIAFILLQNFISTESIILSLVAVAFFIAILLTLITFIIQIFIKKINYVYLLMIFIFCFFGITTSLIAMIYAYFGGF